MGNSRYEAVVTFVLNIDRDILLYILPVDVFFAVAVVAVLSRGRRPLELLSLFLLAFGTLFAVAAVVFTYAFDRPFILLQTYSFP